jgi:hypothetical protein
LQPIFATKKCDLQLKTCFANYFSANYFSIANDIFELQKLIANYNFSSNE